MFRTLAAVALLSVSSIAFGQAAPLPVTPANTVQVTIAGNPIFSGGVVCGYVGNGVDRHEWMATVPSGAGPAIIRVYAPSEVLPGNPVASLMVTLNPHSVIPTTPWLIKTSNLNGPTWNESAAGYSPYNVGTVTVRGS